MTDPKKIHTDYIQRRKSADPLDLEKLLKEYLQEIDWLFQISPSIYREYIKKILE